MTPITARQADRRLVLLVVTRWLPVGLVFGLTVLLPLERGVTLAELGVILAVQGIVVVLLEVPTGGLTDTVGRRPVLLAAGAIAIVSAGIFVTAQGFWMFALAMLLQGLYRALDSGPLEAWFVDAVHADDPTHPVERGLSRAGAALGVAIALGALAGGGLVAWHPLSAWSPLVLPYLVAIAVMVVNLVLVAVLVHEAPRTRAASESVGLRATLAGGFAVLGRSRVLRGLVLVEVFWSVAMIAFEVLTPVRLTELLGTEALAAALFGPASAAAWGLFAVGSALAGVVAARIGVARTAILARLLNGAFVVVMGVAAGPVGLIAAYGVVYLFHGAAGPMHSALLHRQASAGNRAVVLSLNSMVAGGTSSVALLVLGPLAEATSPSFAFIAAGVFSLAGALCYLPALGDERHTLGSTASSSL
ncbi:MFS transporter [Protaetiibacter mangrovi]|uniref:MFS transporter n=1 Tax=Protaetiibacter mangrovi TaxID=2970926 RepID=A0ABT1ZEM6_9MICO|nr:MFS transporter [Protaetiibacter mangrovi]MCS0499121.1 MFS transporter [Protaetiibacter mangrovi]TPX03198.1 MFS transporter [Schumannella luteola]